MQGSVYSRGEGEDEGWILFLGVPIGALRTVFYKFRKCEKKPPKTNKSAGILKIVSQHKYSCKLLHHHMRCLLFTLSGNILLAFATDVSLKNVSYFS